MYVYLGIGSNLGDRLAHLGQALAHLDALPNIALLGVSHAYESAAWPSEDDPAYANAVAVVDTKVEVDDLLALCKEIESEMGRDPAVPRNAPRPIDIDILLAGEEEWVRPDLTVPHPRMAERDFVVTPLLELDPDATYPDGSPVTRASVRVGRVIGVLGTIPGFEDRTPCGDTPEKPPVPVAARPGRTPLPGEQWVALMQHPTESREVGGKPTFVPVGAAPNISVSFTQVILEQEGIPFGWDPFPPEEGADPYGFPRPFSLMVPASMAADAQRALDEASSAPVDWTEAYEMAEDPTDESAPTGDDAEGDTSFGW